MKYKRGARVNYRAARTGNRVNGILRERLDHGKLVRPVTVSEGWV